MGRPDRAARLLRDVLDHVDAVEQGDRARDRAALVLRCNSIITLALTEFLLDGLRAADRRLAEAEAIADSLADDGLRARVAYQRGTIHGRAGDLRTAWEALAIAVRRLDTFTPSEQCAVLLSQGMLALEQSQPRPAVESFAQAAALAHELGSAEQEFMARHNEGYAAYLAGDLPRALAEMDRAARLEVKVSDATARLDRGKVLLEAGLVSEAVELFRAGEAACTARGQAQVRADNQLELARGLAALERHAEATAAATRARAAYRRIGAKAWEARAHLVALTVRLQQLQAKGADSGAAGSAGVDRAARRSARSMARDADGLTTTAEQLGDLELAQRSRTVAAAALVLAGDLPGARARLNGRGRHRHDSLAEELHHVEVASTVLVASGETARARRMLTRAAGLLAAGQRGSVSLDVRTARAVLGVRLATLDLGLARDAGSGAVLESLERWRSATDRLPSLGRVADEELAGLTESLRSVRAHLRERRSPQELAALQRQAARLEGRIRARDWMLGGRDAASSELPIRVREGRHVLRDLDRDLVWFFGHRNRVCALAIIGGRATVRELGERRALTEASRRLRADLRVAATQQLGPLRSVVWDSLRAGAARLDAALIQPWPTRDRGLVLVTCPEVAALPWALLPSLAGRPLTIARSLSAFARRAQVSGDEPPASVHVSVGPDVARGASEAAGVAAAWGGRRVDVAEPSTCAGLVSALAAPGVVHVAAHGIHEPESPLFSSVALHDGPLFAHELQPRGVTADHVVLSACDVGSAAHRPGDQTLGLAASMLALGARSVVAAVAPVPDDVAADVMVRHHQGLARGWGSDDALAAAVGASDPVAAAFLNLGGRWAPALG